MDMARSQAESSMALEGTLSALTLGQRELAQSTEGKFSSLDRGQQDLIIAQSELAYAQIGEVVGLADLAGRITSIESSIHGSRNPSPFADYRVSSPMVDTLTHKTSPRLPLQVHSLKPHSHNYVGGYAYSLNSDQTTGFQVR